MPRLSPNRAVRRQHLLGARTESATEESCAALLDKLGQVFGHEADRAVAQGTIVPAIVGVHVFAPAEDRGEWPRITFDCTSLEFAAIAAFTLSLMRKIEH